MPAPGSPGRRHHAEGVPGGVGVDPKGILGVALFAARARQRTGTAGQQMVVCGVQVGDGDVEVHAGVATPRRDRGVGALEREQGPCDGWPQLQPVVARGVRLLMSGHVRPAEGGPVELCEHARLRAVQHHVPHHERLHLLTVGPGPRALGPREPGLWWCLMYWRSWPSTCGPATPRPWVTSN